MQNTLQSSDYRAFRIKKAITIVSVIFFVLFSLLIQVSVYAQGPSLVPSATPEEVDKRATGDYELNDFIVVAINVSKWILIVSGSLALLAFIVGGFMFILSGGNRELVSKGKASLIGATIGLVVVLLAFTIINYFMQKIGYVDSGTWNVLK